MLKQWAIWQLIDSAFPTGGFAHSSGLEAANQGRQISSEESLLGFCRTAMQQAVHSSLPYVSAVHQNPDCVWDADEHCDVFLSNPISNRASRAQGNGLLVAGSKAFPEADLNQLRLQARKEQYATHLAPMYGLLCNRLQLSAKCAADTFMFVTVRSCLSAAVRLNIIGPLRSQNLQQQLADYAGNLAETVEIPAHFQLVAQTAPVMEMWQSSHDRLYSRLFQS